jgi:hypothetical protein
MTGPLIQAADPVQPLGSATKQYVDAVNIRYRNRIINGDMSVDQRNGGAQIAMGATGWAMDRWRFLNAGSVPSSGSYGQAVISSPPSGFPFSYLISFATSTAYSTPAAGAIVNFYQSIEGYNFLDAQWGTANAQPVVVEFWASAAVAGTYGLAVQNGASGRSYVTTFTLPAATWTKVRVNISGDQSGTWNVAGNAAALLLGFQLCVGSTYLTSTLNAWQTGNFWGATGAANVLGAVNNALRITGVALMVGAAAQNAEPAFKSYADNLIDCQRYYAANLRVYFNSPASGGASTGAVVNSSFPVTMRANPSMVITVNSNSNLNAPVFAYLNPNYFYGGGTIAATGLYTINMGGTADADF